MPHWQNLHLEIHKGTSENGGEDGESERGECECLASISFKFFTESEVNSLKIRARIAFLLWPAML